MERKLMTCEEAADYLGVHPVTLRKKAGAGKVPFIRPFGGNRTRLFFRKESLDALLEERVAEPKAG